MGAVVVGPWKAAEGRAIARTRARAHGDEVADKFRLWAEHLEGLLVKHDQPKVPVGRAEVACLGRWMRAKEASRVRKLEARQKGEK